jgi:hypothetical protein
MNYLGKTMRKPSGRTSKRPDFKKAVITMDQDFVFPDPPDPKNDGAVEIPPQAPLGRGTGRKIVKQIAEYNLRRGYEPPNKDQ